MAEKEGDPRAVRHLRPDAMPPIHMGEVFVDEEQDDDELDMKDIRSWLGELRRPFPDNEIEKFVKPTKHGSVTLDYVGHAGVTDRLLDVDPLWEWEPLALDADGLPKVDQYGGLWIKLTVCGVTRLGYGDAVNKPADTPRTTIMKEIIGDAIRNAAMRFGVALDLWSKIDRKEHADVAAKQEPAHNAEALASLASVCDEHGYDQRTMRKRYTQWRDNPGTVAVVGGPDLTDAYSNNIIAFAAYLIETSAPEPDSGSEAGTVADQKPEAEAGMVGDTEDSG